MQAQGTPAAAPAAPAGGAAPTPPAPAAAATPAAPAAGTQDPKGGTPPAGGAPATAGAPQAQLGQIEGDAAGEPGKPAQAATADVEVKLPEGVNDPVLAKALKEAKGDPQKVADAIFESQNASRLKGEADWKQTQRSWVETLKTDKDFGGTKYADSIRAAEQALTDFGDPELIDWVRESGFRNFPPLVRLLMRVGSATKDSRAAGTQQGTGGAEPSREDRMRAFFSNSPEMFEKKGN